MRRIWKHIREQWKKRHAPLSAGRKAFVLNLDESRERPAALTLLKGGQG